MKNKMTQAEAELINELMMSFNKFYTKALSEKIKQRRKEKKESLSTSKT